MNEVQRPVFEFAVNTITCLKQNVQVVDVALIQGRHDGGLSIVIGRKFSLGERVNGRDLALTVFLIVSHVSGRRMANKQGEYM